MLDTGMPLRSASLLSDISPSPSAMSSSSWKARSSDCTPSAARPCAIAPHPRPVPGPTRPSPGFGLHRVGRVTIFQRADIFFHDAEKLQRSVARIATERRRGAGMSTVEGVSGLEITGARQERYDEVLTPQALELVALLHRELNPRRLELLEARRERVRA